MRIGFTGAYCTANFGDYGILINDISDINANENTVFTYSDSFPHRAIEHYFNKRNVKLIEVRLDEEKIINNPNIITPYEIIDSLFNKKEIFNAISELDVLCVSGGGYIDDHWCKRTDKFLKVMIPVIVAKQLGIKIVFLSQSIGPLTNTKETMRMLFNYLDDTPVAIREDFLSKSYLNEIGVNKNRIHLLPDDLLFVNKDLQSCDYYYPHNGKYIVIVLHDSMDYIISNKDRFVSFANTIKERYDLDVCFLPFDLVWFGYDQSKLLSELIPNSFFVDIEKYNRFLPVEYAYNLINDAEMIITGRYHATIMAQQVNTPFMFKLRYAGEGYSYSYGKMYGSLKRLFGKESLIEENFIATNWESIFNTVEDNFEKIVKYQNNLYNSDAARENKMNMYQQRFQYIKKYIIDRK